MKIDDLTQEELKCLRDVPPKTKEELKDWLITFLGIFLFDTAIDDDNSSPMDFIWDWYSKCILNQQGNSKWSILGMAGRASQKTLACAVIEFLSLLFDKNRDIVHMASIEAQAQVCYQYVKSFSIHQAFMPERIEHTLMTSTKSVNGKNLIVTHGTLNATNAHHGSLLVLDEVDLLPKNIFDEAHGMLSSSILARGMTIYISSRKEPYGRIEDLLTKSAEPNSDIAVHKWGLLEQTEICTNKRSGIDKVNYYVDEERLITLNEEEYSREINKSLYTKMEGYCNCYKCGAFSFCKCNLKKAKTPNLFYMSIDAVVKMFKKEDIDFFKAQRLNKKPTKIGLVYPSWNEAKHLKTYEEMYSIFTGEKKENISFNDLTTSFIKAQCRFCIGIDWGFTSPFVALLMVIDGQDRVYIIDHLTFTGKSDKECVLAVWERWGTSDILKQTTLEFFPDIENPSGIKEIKNIINEKQLNWFNHNEVEKNIDLGIGIVRNFLRVPGTTEARLFVHHSINILKDEMRKWHYAVRKSDREILEKPEDASNHAEDALRYPLASIYWKTLANLYSKDLDEHSQKTMGQKPTDASPKTLGLSNNSALTEEEQVKQIKDGFIKGGGQGFNWSF